MVYGENQLEDSFLENRSWLRTFKDEIGTGPELLCQNRSQNAAVGIEVPDDGD